MQLWVRILGLSQEYWHHQHLFEIAGGIGTPLQLDRATKERAFGYFARVLVDVNLSDILPSSLMVERDGHEFPVQLVYENLCMHYGKVGHDATTCKLLKLENKKLNSAQSAEKLKSIQVNKNLQTTQAHESTLPVRDNATCEALKVYPPTGKAAIVSAPSPSPGLMIPSSPSSTSVARKVEDLVDQIIDAAVDCHLDEIADRVVNEPDSNLNL